MIQDGIEVAAGCFWGGASGVSYPYLVSPVAAANLVTLTPARAVAGWDRHRPVAALCSGSGEAGGGAVSPWARWSILGEPTSVRRFGLEHPDPIGALTELIASTGGARRSPGGEPFAGGWIVALSYELGGVLEPKARGVARGDPAWAWSLVAWRCPGAHVFSHTARRWAGVGSARGEAIPVREEAPQGDHAFTLRDVRPQIDRTEYERMVTQGVEYIRAGDVFQVNLAHTLRGRFDGCARAAFGAMLRRSEPWYGAYLEMDDADTRRCVLSASPELFVQYDLATRRVTTRPIKGTRPGTANARDLEHSPKDRAELTMIVDLMRNDLGRVAEIGSVRVDEPRVIERHATGENSAGVLHGVGTVSATLGRSRTLGDLLRAVFPGGSISGAPKVRAMQIIRELEGDARGLYTGAIGYISDCGNAVFNIAIRTVVMHGQPGDALGTLRGARAEYRVGAGIVSDSIPAHEWDETIAKGGVFINLQRRGAES